VSVTVGAATILVQTLAVLDGGWQCSRRMYPREPVAAITAAVVLSTAAVVLMLEALGTAALLQPAPVLGATVALWLAVRLTVARGARPTVRLPMLELPRGSRPELIAFLSAGALVALLLVALLAAVFEARPQFDALSYHLPIAVQWLQAGNLRILPFVAPNLHPLEYPANYELMELWLLLPVHNDFLVQLASVPGAALSATGTVLLARTLGARLRAAVASALIVLTLPVVLLTQLGTNLADLFMAGAITASAGFLARLMRSGRMRDGVMAGLAAGLAVGARYQALIAVLPLVAIAVTCVIARRRSAARLLRLGLAFAATLAAVGGYWYVRNAVRTGDPLYPQPLSLPFHTFAGARSLACCSGPSWLQLGWQPRVWTRSAEALLLTHPNWAPLVRSWGPMLAALLLAGVTVPIASALRRRQRSVVRWAWAAYPAAQFLCYLATPLGAGANGSAALASSRFMLTSVMAGAAVLAAEMARWRASLQQQVITAALLVSCASAVVLSRDVTRRPSVLLPVVLALAVPALVWLWRGGRLALSKRLFARCAISAAALTVLFAAPLAAHYRGTRNALTYARAAARLGAYDRVAVVGICRIYALYGPDLRRRVYYLTGDDGIDPPLATSKQRWLADLRRHHVSAVLVVHEPCLEQGVPQPQQEWIAQQRDQFVLIHQGRRGRETESLWKFEG
jgi:hypothetical protein